MPESDEREDEGNMDARYECKQAGVTPEIALELTEGAKAFFGFIHKLSVALESAETDWVMDIDNGNVVLTERLTQEHIFVTIMAEALIEGMGEHQLTTNEEIGCVEVLVRHLLALLNGMTGLLGFLVEIAEIALECLRIAIDGNTTYHDVGISHREVTGDEVGRKDAHVAIDEEQIGVLGLPSEEIANGSATTVLGADDVSAVRPLVDLTVDLYHFRIGGAIIGHKYLIADAGCLRLEPEGIHQRDAKVVEGGDQYRQ